MKKIKYVLIILLIMVLIIVPKSKTQAEITLKNKTVYTKIQQLLYDFTVGEEKRRNFVNTSYDAMLGKRLMEDYGGGYGTTINYSRAACLSHNQTSDTQGGQYRIETVIDVGYNKNDGFFVKSYYMDSLLEHNKSLITYTDEDNGKKAFIEQFNYAIKMVETEYSNSGGGINSDQEAYIGYLIRKGITNKDNGEKWIQANNVFNTQVDNRAIYNTYNQNASNTQLKEFKAVKAYVDNDNTKIKKDNNKYTIGPIKLDYNGKTIEKIKINGNEVEEAKWKYKDESGEANKNIDEIPVNEWIELTVESSDIRENDDNSITFCQEKIEYYKGRVLLLRSINEQQYGIFVGVPEYKVAEDTIELGIPSTNKVLQIQKTSENTEENLPGVELKIYADIEGKAEHWLKLGEDDQWEYKENMSDGGSFITDENGKIKLENLEKGAYYIYEVKAAEGYNLEDQRRFYSNHPEGEEPKNAQGTKYSDIEIDGIRPVYLCNTQLSDEKPKRQIQAQQYDGLTLKINKYDNNSGDNIEGVGLKILTNIDGQNKWIAESDGTISYADTIEEAKEFITDKDGNIQITGLMRSLDYYIYETKAASGYNIEAQRNYYPDSNDSNNIANGYGTPVFLHKYSAQVTGYRSYIYTEKEQYQLAKLTIKKKDHYDEQEVLNGIEFAIFVRDSGWLGYDESKNQVTFQNNWQNAYRFKTGSSYCEEERIDGEFTLDNLEYGDYFVIEVSTGFNSKYELIEQPGYNHNSNYEFLVDENEPNNNKWKMIDSNGNPIESVLIGSESYNEQFTEVKKSNEKSYNFKRNVQDNQCDYIHLDWYEHRVFSEERGSYDYGANYATYIIDNVDIPDLTIVKKDADTGRTLKGSEFWIEAQIDSNDGQQTMSYYVKPETDENGDLRATYQLYDMNDTSEQKQEKRKIKIENGEITIKGLVDGIYNIYETKAPDGYRLDLQENYREGVNGSSGYVNCGSVTVQNGIIQPPRAPNPDSEAMEYNYDNGKYEITVKNIGYVDIKGYVWEEYQDKKLDLRDNIYNGENSNDKLYESGMTVNLYKYNEQYTESSLIATTKTFTQADVANDNEKKIGHYEFLQLVKKDELPYCYVEFIYDNKQYICVDPFIGPDSTVNSKAQEYTMELNELKDENLTGDSGDVPGRAVTSPREDTVPPHKLEFYLNDENTVDNINLGIVKKFESEFMVNEEVAYAKIVYKDHVYKYEYYSEQEQQSKEQLLYREMTEPLVYFQVSEETFSQKIYSSEIAKNIENPGDLEVYMVYRIHINNLTVHDYVDNYYEDRMYVTELKNNYDKNRYYISDETTNLDSQDVIKDISSWDKDSTKTGVTTCTLPDTYQSNKYSEGIEPGQHATTYIQFRLTEEAIKQILNKELTREILKVGPSTAYAKTFHEYWRTDNVWKDGDYKFYEGKSKQDSDYNKPSNKAYLHKTEEYDDQSGERYMRFDLPKDDNGELQERTIKGKVFKDEITQKNKKDAEDKKPDAKALGNGIIDSGELSANGVLVELVESKASDAQPVTLYQYSSTADSNGNKYQKKQAVQVVGEEGEYEFKGVLPGYYYIRFTYGDGTVEYKDLNNQTKNETVQSKFSDGNSIQIKDFKSTIINNDVIKDAKEETSVGTENTKAEWYKNDGVGENYSTAVDELEERKETDGYIYNRDRKTYKIDGSGNEIQVNDSEVRKLIDSYTPQSLITIENDLNRIYKVIRYNVNAEGTADNYSEENVNKPVFGGFNFGIINAPPINITTEKVIKDIKLTNQVGTVLVSGKPTYFSAVEKTRAMIEIEQSVVYGAAINATYEITLKNDSPYLDYVESSSSNYGYYYKYGIITDSTNDEKKVTIRQLQDVLDMDYSYKAIFGDDLQDKEITAEKYNKVADNNQSESITMKPAKDNVYITVDGFVKGAEGVDNATLKNVDCIYFEGWTGIKKGEYEKITYEVSGQLGSSGDQLFVNNTEITKISLDKLTTLASGSKWHELKATSLTITPPTGQNRSYEVFILPCVILIITGVGIVLIKKYVL